ncbi:MAG: bifunctional aspartate transaminase/aspartate 4-decarboxylase [Actinomycetia bacterium]|nr:bifunctional aspartate transaminase/aspartate 4-decarboxylase [Actinomycetes bacterium]
MSHREEEKRYEALSPFELKNELQALAGSADEALMLNAGRGNPNWVATEPRRAYAELMQFALDESERNPIRDGFGGTPQRDGIASRLRAHLEADGAQGAALLGRSLDWVGSTLGIDADDFVVELCDAILGDHYPVPVRMLTQCEKVVDAYLALVLAGGSWPTGNFELFATEGGTAAMTYVFNSLAENRLLHKGDKIALGTPIFTPYLEIPELNDYELVILEVEQSESDDWRYSADELEKLADPDVKAFFVVNPSNPASRAMHADTLAAIGELVQDRRGDLILLTDDVYGTFVDDFRSLAAAAPHNTVLVYSWSKFFGATGWRLGAIGLHEDNVLDRLLADLPRSDRDELAQRYSTVFLDPAAARMIDRLTADSRTVALNHTAGLSTPQQVMMTLFSLHALTEGGRNYQQQAQAIVRARIDKLYAAMGVEHSTSQWDTSYYTIIDVPQLAEDRHGAGFREWLTTAHEPIDFVWRLAQEREVVLMDGGGFEAPDMSVRVSLANLRSEDYVRIGEAISGLLEDYHSEYEGDR